MCIRDSLSIHSQVLNGRSHHVSARLGLGVQDLDRSLVTITHDKLRIVRVKSEKRTLATRRIGPTCGADTAATQLAARNRHRGVVLLSSIDSIGKLVVDVDAIELALSLIHISEPT